jgi:hypothetical protein
MPGRGRPDESITKNRIKMTYIKKELTGNNDFVKEVVLDFSDGVIYGFCNVLNVGHAFWRYSIIVNKSVFGKQLLIIKMIRIID